jgi:hypothetical protein
LHNKFGWILGVPFLFPGFCAGICPENRKPCPERRRLRVTENTDEVFKFRSPEVVIVSSYEVPMSIPILRSVLEKGKPAPFATVDRRLVMAATLDNDIAFRTLQFTSEGFE